MIEALGEHESTPPEALDNTELHQKSRLNHENDIYEVNQDLISEILSSPDIDTEALRELYERQGITTYKEALWAAADYYLKLIQTTGHRADVENIYELYQYGDVTPYSEQHSQSKQLDIKEVSYLAGIYGNVTRAYEQRMRSRSSRGSTQ